MKASPAKKLLKTNLYTTITGVAIAVSLLVGCSGQTHNVSTTSHSEKSQTASSIIDTDSDVDTDADASKRAESVYTSLALNDCEVLETNEESGSSAFRCQGYQEIPLYVTKSDLRFDVDAGIPNEEWTSLGRPFNSIGDTVEWRIHDGEPVAAILRFNFETGGVPNNQSSELAVFSVGQEGSPGCLMEWVTADAQPNQNTAARQVADRQAKDFNCSAAASAEEIQLPESAIGTFDTTQVDCSERMTFSRLTTTQDRFDFYYGYANVDTISLRDGGYDIEATLFQLEGVEEVRPETVKYRIELQPQNNGIQFFRQSLSEEMSPSSLVRCIES